MSRGTPSARARAAAQSSHRRGKRNVCTGGVRWAGVGLGPGCATSVADDRNECVPRHGNCAPRPPGRRRARARARTHTRPGGVSCFALLGSGKVTSILNPTCTNERTRLCCTLGQTRGRHAQARVAPPRALKKWLSSRKANVSSHSSSGSSSRHWVGREDPTSVSGMLVVKKVSRCVAHCLVCRQVRQSITSTELGSRRSPRLKFRSVQGTRHTCLP